MPRVLEASEIDEEAAELDEEIGAAQEQKSLMRAEGRAGDLTDGGKVSFGGNIDAYLYPMKNGKRVTHARPAAIRAWMWNGTESVLPLSWNPEGTRHDGGRHYLLKKHCLCCNIGGFTGIQCPNCIKTMCSRCNGRPDKKTVIRCFYLHQDDVPYPERFYGPIPCFMPFCVRRGDRGFKTEQDMRMHAQSKHTLEYRAYLDTQRAAKDMELDTLRTQVNLLIQQQLTPRNGNDARTEEQITAAKEKMAKARAARKPVAQKE